MCVLPADQHELLKQGASMWSRSVLCIDAPGREGVQVRRETEDM